MPRLHDEQSGLLIRSMRNGDRVTLRGVPGRWRVTSVTPDGIVWLEGKDSSAQDLANMSPAGIVGVTSQEVLLDTSLQGELL